MRTCEHIRRTSARIWRATANPDGPGLLERGHEFQPILREDFDPLVVDAILRLAHLSAGVADLLRDSPDPSVRRSVAVLAARAHPVLEGLSR
jgi:hypothetical protein